MEQYNISEPMVPYYVHEGILARNERTIKRLIVALIVAIAVILAGNGLWLYAWMQYDYSSSNSSVEIDGEDGVANYIGNNGDISNGVDTSNKKSQKTN